MDDSTNINEIWSITKEYKKNARAELYERWKLWKIKHSKREAYEAIGGLLARMVTLAVEMAGAPSIWNGHIAPIILRTMVDTYIKLAWILGNRHERAKKYIDYGLGQEKLEIEHRRKYLESKGSKPDEDEFIKAREEWLNSQKYSFLTKVNNWKLVRH